jgi:hypothetical protein
MSRGVNLQDGKYVARISVAGLPIYLGRYSTEADAVTAYDRAREACGRQSEELLPQRLVKRAAARRAYSRKYRFGHLGQVTAANHQWLQDNPERFKELVRKNRALKYGLTRWLTAEQWTTLKEAYGNRCLCCGRHEDELRAAGLTLSPDHVIPLEKGGLCCPENIQPLCHARRKGVRWGCNNAKHLGMTDYRPSKAA